MDAVLPHAPADHQDAIAVVDALVPPRGAGDGGRSDGSGAAEHKRLSGEPLIEQDRAVHRRDARLVPAVLDSAAHAGEHAPRMKLARQERPVVVRPAEAEDVGVEQETPSPATGAQRVAVVAEDARDRASVGVHGRRAVVRFHLPGEHALGVDSDDAGVVVEHLDQPVLAPRAQLALDRPRRRHDVGAKQRVDLRLATRRGDRGTGSAR